MLCKLICTLLLLCSTACCEQLWIRASHTSFDTGTVDILLNNSALFTKVAYQDFTEYKELQSGLYTVKVRLSNTDQDILHINLKIDGTNSLRHTLALLGEIKSPTNTPLELKLLTDNLTAPSLSALSRFRVFHAVANAPTFDIRLDGILVFKSLNYKDVSQYLQFNAGTYLLEIYHTGTWGHPLLQLKDAKFGGGKVYTVFIEGTVGGDDNTALTAVMQEDISFTYLHLRFAHASPDAGVVSVYADDASAINSKLLFNHVPFKEICPYIAVPHSDYNIKITKPNQPDNVLALIKPSLDADQEYTLTLTGFLLTPNNRTAPLKPVLTTDNGAPPSADSAARVRFIHMSPGTPAVDIRIKGRDNKLVDHLAYTSASDYHELSAEHYSFDVFATGSSETPILSFPYQFHGGRIYSVFLEGVIGNNASSALSAIVHMDKTFAYFTVRVAHAAFGADKIDVLLDDKLLFGGISFGEISSYSHILLKRSSTLKITRAGHHDEILYSVRSPFTRKHTYTVTLIGSSADNTATPVDAIVSIDDKLPPASALKAKIRFIHAAANGVPALDFRMNDKLLFNSVHYRTATKYEEVDADTYQFKFLASGSLISPLHIKDDVKLEGGHIYTAFLEGALGQELHLKLFSDFNYHFTSIKFAHAAAGLGDVDVLLDGKLAFHKLAFKENSEFKSVVVNPDEDNELNVTLVHSGSPHSLVYQSQLKFGQDKFTTLVLAGLKNSDSTPLELLSVVGNWDAKKLGLHQASVGVVHAAPGAPPVDVLVDDGTKIAMDLEYSEAAPFTTISAQTYSNIRVVIHATQQQLLVLPATDFATGSVYSIFIEGVPSDTKYPLTAIVTKDFKPKAARAHVRLIQAAHEAPSVDVLFDGEMKMYDVEYKHASQYHDIPSGRTGTEVVTVPTGDLAPHLTKTHHFFHHPTNYTLLLAGFSGHSEHPLATHLFEDINVLPRENGQIKIRFIHAVPDAGPVDITIKAGGNKIALFKNMSFGDAQYAHAISDDRYWMQVFPSGVVDYGNDEAALFGRDFDLKTRGSAIYTVVATGFLKASPGLDLVSFLDVSSDSDDDGGHGHRGKNGLSGVAIALIVIGVVVAVLVIGALIAFIVFRQKRWRRQKGYTPVPE